MPHAADVEASIVSGIDGGALERLAAIAVDRERSSDSQIAGILHLLGEALAVGATFLSQVEVTTLRLVQAYDRAGMGLRAGMTVPLCDTYCSIMLNRGTPFQFVPDAQDDSTFVTLPTTLLLGIGSYSGVPVYDADGHLYGTLCALHPTARTMREGEIALLQIAARLVVQAIECAAKVAQLVATEAQLRAIYHGVACGVVVRDRDGFVLDANPAGEQILGESLEELRNAGPHRRYSFHRMDATPVSPAYVPTAVVRRTGQVQRNTLLKLVRRDGQQRVIEANAVPIFGTDGTVMQVVASFIDVTDRAHVEEAEALAMVSAVLSSSLEPADLYQAILSHVAMVLPCHHSEIVLYQDDWAVMAANWGEPCVPPNTRLFSLSGRQESGMPFDDNQPTIISDTAEMTLWRDLPPWQGQYRLRSVLAIPLVIDGVPHGRFSLFSFTPHFFTDRYVRLACSFGERIAQAMRNARLYMAEQSRRREAEALAKVREDFVASVSHELRTPLTAILGFAELLQLYWTQVDDGQRLSLLHNIVTAANRQKRIVEDLLLLTTLDNDAVTPLATVQDFSKLLQRAAEEVQQSFAGQRIDLVGQDAVLIWADAGRVVQVVINLMDNAAKYSAEGSPIVVSWGVEEGLAVLRVCDHGPGVPEAGREQLFSRFGRLPGSRTRSGRVGTGLGLYLSRRLVKTMGGDLDLEATGPSGSIFRLRLPLYVQNKDREDLASRTVTASL